MSNAKTINGSWEFDDKKEILLLTKFQNSPYLNKYYDTDPFIADLMEFRALFFTKSTVIKKICWDCAL